MQAFSTGNSSGAPPYRFIQTATKEPTSTYEHILNSIRNIMGGSGIYASLRFNFISQNLFYFYDGRIRCAMGQPLGASNTLQIIE